MIHVDECDCVANLITLRFINIDVCSIETKSPWIPGSYHPGVDSTEPSGPVQSQPIDGFGAQSQTKGILVQF